MRHLLITMTVMVLAACASPPAFAPATTPLELTGEITRADHQTYREIPFTPPPGTGKISIDFAYTGKDQKTVIDIGVRDPEGQRGWSGGNKSHIEISEGDATPSYRPGPIQMGEWKLVLGIPNIRDGQTASYTATIRFSGAVATATQQGSADPIRPLATEPGWWRGDFHTHTAHSDGSCDVSGQRQPCPTLNTADAARAAGLDFVAITDHNTITQLADIRRMQREYPNTLMIPGTEVTMFFGHANVIGNAAFVDFQLGSERLPKLGKLFDEAAAQGAFVSVNHPNLPSGEVCMGCGWTVKDTDWSRVTAIEVVNGSTLRTSGAEGGFSGIAFWDKLLREGHRITAIGGSDNHDATDRTGAKQSPVGRPATVVYADELSTIGIVAGVKSGRAFVDAVGLPGAVLDMNATGDGQEVNMGGEFRLREGKAAILTFWHANTPPGAGIVFVSENIASSGRMRVAAPPAQRGAYAEVDTVQLTPGAARGYIRPEVRSADGKLLLLGNPIYFVGAAAP